MARRKTMPRPPGARNAVAKSGAGAAISKQAKARLEKMGAVPPAGPDARAIRQRQRYEGMPEGIRRGSRRK